MAADVSLRRPGRSAVRLVVVTISSAATAWLVGSAVSSVAGNAKAPWLLGRAAGVSSYLLIVALVMLGLLLAHPAGTRLRRIPRATLLRIHVSLASFTLAFTVLHIVALASDRYAGVGWRGALVPGLAAYRPLPISLGVIGLYAGLLAGITAAAAGRLIGRVWWPIHKVAIISLVLVWAHGLLSGSDTTALLALYIVTGSAVVLLAVSRYTVATNSDDVDEFLSRTDPETALQKAGHTR
jgi:hypothetical protein